jgi:hypothetical protein
MMSLAMSWLIAYGIPLLADWIINGANGLSSFPSRHSKHR